MPGDLMLRVNLDTPYSQYGALNAVKRPERIGQTGLTVLLDPATASEPTIKLDNRLSANVYKDYSRTYGMITISKHN